jgi:hypothetical protein
MPLIIRRTAMKWMAVCIVIVLVSSLAWAGSKTYQATGPVVDVRDDAIVIDKGKEGKWEIARDANTKVNGTLQKGTKVTVYYRMQATEIEAKEANKQKKQ